MISNMSNESFDSFAADYDRFAGVMHDTNLPLLNRVLESGERALDAGCGSGWTTELLADKYKHVVGFDLSHEMISIAKERHDRNNIEYIESDLFKFEDNDKFDLVYSHTMMHHIPEYENGLVHLKSLVKTDGILVIIDNVAGKYRTPPKWSYTIPAKLDFLSNVAKYGLKEASFLLAFWHNKKWLDHLLSDKYLFENEYREIYGRVFPGATFENIGYGIMTIWKKDKVNDKK